MCGRFTLCTPEEQLALRFGIQIPAGGIPVSYNAAPTQKLPVVLQNGHRHVEMFRWGLIPSWAKEASVGARMINARSETVAEKPAFRRAFKSRRCLVLADSFYEWKTTSSGKQPVRFLLKSKEPFAFAGLWEKWRDPESEGREVYTFTVLTTDANEVVAPVHNRMPMILPRDSEDIWLNVDERDELLAMLKPYSAEQMTAYAVSRDVNSARNNNPSLIEPVAEQGTLF